MFIPVNGLINTDVIWLGGFSLSIALGTPWNDLDPWMDNAPWND